jgi:hypothetical protein
VLTPLRLLFEQNDVQGKVYWIVCYFDGCIVWFCVMMALVVVCWVGACSRCPGLLFPGRPLANARFLLGEHAAVWWLLFEARMVTSLLRTVLLQS